jgi:hypothetical protein
MPKNLSLEPIISKQKKSSFNRNLVAFLENLKCTKLHKIYAAPCLEKKPEKRIETFKKNVILQKSAEPV